MSTKLNLRGSHESSTDYIRAYFGRLWRRIFWRRVEYDYPYIDVLRELYFRREREYLKPYGGYSAFHNVYDTTGHNPYTVGSIGSGRNLTIESATDTDDGRCSLNLSGVSGDGVYACFTITPANTDTATDTATSIAKPDNVIPFRRRL